MAIHEKTAPGHQRRIRLPHFHVQDTWEFAHQVCGRVWWRMGWLVLALSAALLAWMETRPGGEQTNWLLGTLVALAEAAVLILTIIPVERALKKTFDKEGNRR